jgi:hypothetical protein
MMVKCLHFFTTVNHSHFATSSPPTFVIYLMYAYSIFITLGFTNMQVCCCNMIACYRATNVHTAPLVILMTIIMFFQPKPSALDGHKPLPSPSTEDSNWFPHHITMMMIMQLKHVIFWDVTLCSSCVKIYMQDLHSATSQNMTFFIVTAVKASNLR